MLKVIYGREYNENIIKATSNYFNQHYKDEWFLDSFIKRIVLDVDNVKVEQGKLINKTNDVISPKSLSGGVKVLIAAYYNTYKIFDVSACGDNCAKWLLDIGKRKDITVNLSHVMDFKGEFRMEIVNNHKIACNKQEYLDAILPYIGR